VAAVSITVSDDFETFQHGDDALAGTRSLEMARFLSLSLADKGFVLLRFLGMSVLACRFCKP
jgi:hypothetical protein